MMYGMHVCVRVVCKWVHVCVCVGGGGGGGGGGLINTYRVLDRQMQLQINH